MSRSTLRDRPGRALVFIGTLMLLAGCAGPSSTPGRPPVLPEDYPRSAAHIVGPALTPTPFTAEEIRRNCREGRVARWRMVTPEGTFISEQSFVSADAEGATVRSIPRNTDGEPLGEPRESRGRWSDFQSHAAFPADKTVISRDRTVVPAGEFDCWVLTVTSGDTISTFWFARDEPGPPVRLRQVEGVVVRLDMQLVELER